MARRIAVSWLAPGDRGCAGHLDRPRQRARRHQHPRLEPERVPRCVALGSVPTSGAQSSPRSQPSATGSRRVNPSVRGSPTSAESTPSAPATRARRNRPGGRRHEPSGPPRAAHRRPSPERPATPQLTGHSPHWRTPGPPPPTAPPWPPGAPPLAARDGRGGPAHPGMATALSHRRRHRAQRVIATQRPRHRAQAHPDHLDYHRHRGPRRARPTDP